MNALLLSLAMVTNATPAPDTVVVCHEEFLETLKPWFAHRQQQGHVLSHITNQATAEEIRDAIRLAAKGGELKHVVLVGDSPSFRKRNAARPKLTVPTHYVDAKVNVLFGSDPEIATDNWYADLDDDRIPDLTIGRITADNPNDLARIVKKILAYETASLDGKWQTRINCVAGVGGFGQVADSVIEMTAKKFLVEGVPAGYSTQMAYGSWRSPYCPDPRRFHLNTVSTLNDGCLFWVYIGHGQKTFLDRVHVPEQSYHILDTQDMPKIGSREGMPIAIFLACYTGAYDHFYDCLGEEMLRRERGPIAVLAGSRVTMPYAMSVLSHGLMQEYFVEKRATIGEVFLKAKQRLAEERKLPKGKASTRDRKDVRLMLDSLAAVVSPRPELMDEERKEHLDIFNLLGDPLLRLPHAVDFKLHTEKNVIAGETMELMGQCPLAGKCTIEIVNRRDRPTMKATGRSKFDSDPTALLEYDDAYRTANHTSWTSYEIDFAGGALSTQIKVPPQANGPCHVRIYVQGVKQYAVGSADIFVRRAKQERTASKPE